VADVNAETGIAEGPFGLSDEERAQIERLQTQLDNGEITAEAFATQVDAILGDLAPHAAFAGFGFFGAPFGDRLRHFIAEKLGLTEEQQTAARAIFEDTHQQIRILRLTALANIRLQLTDEQRAKLDALRDERFASIRDDAPVPPGAFRGRGFLPGRPGERRGHEAIRERIRGFFERLAAELGITDAQRTAIQGIRDQLRADVRAAHQRAREAFKALLTAEQLAILEQIEARIQEHIDQPGDESGERDHARENEPK
jgi:Spy/CpxP family protein refolding chaperone